MSNQVKQQLVRSNKLDANKTVEKLGDDWTNGLSPKTKQTLPPPDNVAVAEPLHNFKPNAGIQKKI
jgi:hypothetical protein